jgi:hypothetical protein
MTPTINSVTPSTWIAGETYPITITGTNFTTLNAAAQTSCPVTQVTVSVNGRNLPLSNPIVNNTTITAEVAPAASEPTEWACVALSGEATIAYVAKGGARAFATPMAANATPTTSIGDQCNGSAGNYTAATYTTQILAPQLYVIDPYLLSSASSGTIEPDAVISALSDQSNYAAGIIADGTSTGIAVFGPVPKDQDVTFTTDNGATPVAWDSAFLTPSAPLEPSNSGAPPLVVPSAKLIEHGGFYYALALVTAGTPSTSTILGDTHVTVISPSGDQPNQPLSLVTYPVPVVLVHGLWGGKGTLASTMNYLNSNTPLSSDPIFVKPICYSKYFSFDAPTDTANNAGTGCEVTATFALSTYLTNLYKELDTDNIVGGRVDIVAHSMGGLVARYFSNSGSGLTADYYNNPRNRNQGTFRDIITLDTPEEGSALASWLDFYFATKTKSPTAKSAWVWNILCFPHIGNTVQDCMANELFGAGKQPLALPGDRIENGAVFSLIPNNPHLNNLPDPNIPNATWFAIASDFTDDGHKPPSLLRQSLNKFLGATLPAPQSGKTSPPIQQPNGDVDFNFILGYLENPNNSITPLSYPEGPMHNDAIVTVDSQLFGNPSKSYTFLNLSHTSIPIIGSLLPNSSNQSVTNDSSNSVNGQIVTWLGYQDSSSPTTDMVIARTAVAFKPALNEWELNLEANNKDIFAADDRLKATIPDRQVEVAQPLRIPLTVAGGEIVSVIVSQGNTEETFDNESAVDGSAVGSGDANVVHDDGATKTIEIVPLQVGKVKLDITVFYADGGIAHFGDSLTVAPSSKGLRKFSLNGAFSVVPIVLEDKDEDRQFWLSPEVEYTALKNPLYLTDSTQIKFTIEQPESAPVISLDSNGMIHGLRPGRAVITGEFDGVRDKITVEVYTKENAPSGYRHVHQHVNP